MVKKKEILKVFLIFIGNCLTSSHCLSADTESKPNVLFIAIDDLRPTLGCYGDVHAISPNIDKLSSKGTLFTHFYCQQAVCNPSRASLLTGLRPDQEGVTNLKDHFREKLPDVVTLPQLFRENGYESIGLGKIYHGAAFAQDSISWSEPALFNLSLKSNEYFLPAHKMAKGKSVSYECVDVVDEAYEDGQIAREAIRRLNGFKESGKPFFLAVGFKKPHLPFCAPKKYWDMYDDSLFKSIPNPDRPLNAPDVAFHHSEELRGYKDVPKQGAIDLAKEKTLWHGYYTCVSYVDTQLGKILNTLDQLGLTKNTIIVLWGDNGYHLGEQDLWCKSTNFELDTRIPLIISTPGQKQTGTKSNSIVEAVDIYPTLADLCHLKPKTDLAGVSLTPILSNPNAKVKEAAFSQFVRPYAALFKPDAKYMGYTVRTKDWRCTAWFNLQNDSLEYRELYNLRKNSVERKNLSGEKKYEHIENLLIQKLRNYRNGIYN